MWTRETYVGAKGQEAVEASGQRDPTWACVALLDIWILNGVCNMYQLEDKTHEREKTHGMDAAP
jgi:hypothetical protein